MARIKERDVDRKDTYQEQLINVRRVSKVVKGGRIFGFSALTVVGDGEGRVGMGRGKAREVPVAVQKAMEDAKRNMFSVQMNGTTLQYPMVGRHGAARVVLRPATEGTGIIAGGTMRAVFEVVGIENVLTKIIGTTNPVNVTRATIAALKGMRSADYVAAKRGKKVRELRPTQAG
ncbi:MAG: 30S ribosomal protein S5 [Gammaproteobacteria bacterium]|nr:30S ribosomal protein S5 [Gammaproteobacteria bacterium]